MKFAVDSMLGRLVRWLRLSGYDASYKRKIDDCKLLEIAKKEQRILLTRDNRLVKRARDEGIESELIDGNHIESQLVQLVSELGIRLKSDPEESRCPACNGEISRIGKEKIKDEIPEGVLENFGRFYGCSRCGKVYWKGGHWKNIRKIVEKVERDVQNSKGRAP